MLKPAVLNDLAQDTRGVGTDGDASDFFRMNNCRGNADVGQTSVSAQIESFSVGSYCIVERRQVAIER